MSRKRTLEEEADLEGKLLTDKSVLEAIDNKQLEWLKTQKELINPLLTVPCLDPHKDTPTEPLHTVLLGVIKYIWGTTCKGISDAGQLSLLETRLTSIDTDGLGIPPLRAGYLIQYRGGLIGHQFKAIMQTMVFVLHGLVSGDIMKVWCAAGKVGGLL